MTDWDGTRWVATSSAPPRRPRPVRHLLGAVAEATINTALVFGLIASSTFAAKGGQASTNHHGGGGGGTISGPVMVRDANGNGAANYMDDITFDVSTTASDRPLVGL